MSAQSSPREVRRVALSSFVGTTIEYYDFFLYATAAALVFGKVFFSALPPLAGTIVSFATLAVGYVGRLFGGIVFGHLGDKLGRKAVLLASMIIMGTASGCIGLLPTDAQVGPAAAILLVLLRVCQGIAVGGEWGGAALMTVEHARPGTRGLVSSAVSIGGPGGSMLGYLAWTFVSFLPSDQVLSWGWRVPFLASFLLLGVGVYVRVRITESPLFLELRRDPSVKGPPPILEVLLKEPRKLVVGVLVGLGTTTQTGIFTAFALSYAKGLGYSTTAALVASMVGSVFLFVGCPLTGWLSDRIGRRPVALIGAVAAAVFAYPAFLMINSRSVALLIVALMVTHGIINSFLYGPLPSLLSELFETRIRYTGASAAYQLSQMLGAGFGPLAASALLLAAGGGSDVGGVVGFAVAVFVICGVATRFTAESYRLDLAGEDRSDREVNYD